MLENDNVLEAITMILICLLTLIIRQLLNLGNHNLLREQQHVKWKKEQKLFQVVLTDSEFNTLLDETNYVD
ncbi:unnamed protein product [Paramecium sonneborni]|uniref:Uncharacterized protein n=1 Tax=Paramecium sonneborni TaxID=65129 RepID=A0A8S1RCV7_9CILI|nr:unnamed protein product [Paramecium sonneborni]